MNGKGLFWNVHDDWKSKNYFLFSLYLVIYLFWASLTNKIFSLFNWHSSVNMCQFEEKWHNPQKCRAVTYLNSFHKLSLEFLKPRCLYKMSFLTSIASGLGVDSKYPFVETLAAFNYAGKRQIFTINIICIDYYGVIFWPVTSINTMYM